ncbi:MAG: deoxynucleoside kinase [Bacteroidetes bacterium]|nr:deoxynucleoside kinase [Bacteroidota bacterium]
MNKVIISIEGLAGAGKTTLVNHLKKQNFELLPEIMDFVPETGVIKRFTLDASSSSSTNEWFLNIEIERLNKALHSNVSIVMDRCFISQIAYNYAKDATYKTKTLCNLKKLMEPNRLIVPNIIYLQMETQLSIDRMLARNKNNQKYYIQNGEPDYQYNFIENNRLFYEKIIPLFQDNILVIDAKETADKKAGRINDWIKNRETHVADFNINSLFFQL